MESVRIPTDMNEGVEATIVVRDLHYPFPEYNVATGIPYLKTNAGTLKQIRNKRVVLKNKNNELEVVAIVGKSFALVPNELVEDMVEKAVEAYGLTMLKKMKDRYENTLRIDLLSSKIGEVEVGDRVQFGVSIRNSIDGSSSLAVDAFSYRLKCRNGATAKIPELTFVVKHIGDPKELIKMFNRALSEALEKTERLLLLYQNMTKKPLTREGAEAIVRLGFPHMYLKYTPILIREGGREEVDLRYTGVSLWDTFNAITRVITHESRASPLARSYMTHRLHRVMQNLVAEA